MAGPAYQWGAWRYEPTECRLLRGGVPVQLHAKSLDLLTILLRRAPRLVTKEEILASVWPDAAVEEGNIAFHVAALRKVLDEGADQSAIETVRGRGYRFVHDVAIHQMPATDDIRQVVTAPPLPPRAVPVETAPARGSLSVAVFMLLAGVVIGAAGFASLGRPLAPPMTTIAVMPFEIIDALPGQEHLPDGLGPYLTSRLGKANVTVAPRETAAAVLSGQLQPAKNGFRVTVQLTRLADNARLWDWSFDQDADEGKPPASAGPDDARSRVQGNIAGRVADGVARYLTLIGR